MNSGGCSTTRSTPVFTARKQLLYCAAVCRLRGESMPADYDPILDELEEIAEGDRLPTFRAGVWFSDWLGKQKARKRWPHLTDRLDDLQRRASEVLKRRYDEILGPNERSHWEGDPRFDADDAVMYALMVHPFACCFGDGHGGITHSRPEAELLRELLGNPFRRISLDPAWQSSTILGLARSVDEDRTFEVLPILGDALEDVGADGVILGHLRTPGPHVRGCRALDLILGKV